MQQTMEKTAAKKSLAALGTAKKLPEELRSGMEHSFRTDFSSVNIYESPVVSENGAQAAASGSSIAFAPGKADFSSAAGRELLGHELSHIASQAKGEVHGSGILNDAALEHRADSEGARAARGLSAFDESSGETLTPMSTAGASNMGAPMQAKKALEYTPSAGEQLKARRASNNEDSTQALVETANYRRLLASEETPRSLPADQEAAYQKAISGLSKKDLKKMLGKQESFAGAQMGNFNKLSGKLGEGGAETNMAHDAGTEEFRGYEALRNDILAANHGSARRLNALTGEGGAFENMPQTQQMYSHFGTNDAPKMGYSNPLMLYNGNGDGRESVAYSLYKSQNMWNNVRTKKTAYRKMMELFQKIPKRKPGKNSYI